MRKYTSAPCTPTNATPVIQRIRYVRSSISSATAEAHSGMSPHGSPASASPARPATIIGAIHAAARPRVVDLKFPASLSAPSASGTPARRQLLPVHVLRDGLALLHRHLELSLHLLLVRVEALVPDLELVR